MADLKMAALSRYPEPSRTQRKLFATTSPHEAKFRPFPRFLRTVRNGFLPEDSVGGDPTERPMSHFMVGMLLDHDAIGNRPFGDRISQYVNEDVRKALMVANALGPWHPQIFMGTEFDAVEPWMFFPLARR